jgi:hypothetical protein
VPGIGVDRERELPRQAVVVQDERLAGKPHRLRECGGRAQLVDIILDPAVGRAEVLGEEPGLLAVAGEEVAGQVNDVLVGGVHRDLHAHRGELEEDGADGGAPLGQPHGAVGSQANRTLHLHAIPPPAGLCRSSLHNVSPAG